MLFFKLWSLPILQWFWNHHCSNASSVCDLAARTSILEFFTSLGEVAFLCNFVSQGESWERAGGSGLLEMGMPFNWLLSAHPFPWWLPLMVKTHTSGMQLNDRNHHFSLFASLHLLGHSSSHHLLCLRVRAGALSHSFPCAFHPNLIAQSVLSPSLKEVVSIAVLLKWGHWVSEERKECPLGSAQLSSDFLSWRISSCRITEEWVVIPSATDSAPLYLNCSVDG